MTKLLASCFFLVKPESKLCNVQIDAAVLGDRLAGGHPKASAQAAPLCSAGVERARKCLQGWHLVRYCQSTHGLLFRGSAGVTSQEGPTIKKVQSRSKFSVSIEIYNLARNFQSRRLDVPKTIRAAVGGSLKNFILARNLLFF